MTSRYERKHPFDVRELATPDGFERIRALCTTRALTWYLQPHSHTCPRCQRVLTHTGLEATREGDASSHRCCGEDVRP